MVRDNHLRYRDQVQIANDIKRRVGDSWITERLDSQISPGNTRFITGRKFYKESLALFLNRQRLLEPEDYRVVSDNAIEIKIELNKGDKVMVDYVPVE